MIPESPSSTTSLISGLVNTKMPCPYSSLEAHDAANFSIEAFYTFEVTVVLFVALVVVVSILSNRILSHLRRQPFPQTGSESKHHLPVCPVTPHPLFGHMAHIMALPTSIEYESFFRDNANESGISTFWFLNTPCVGVLKGEHARIVLRSSSKRNQFTIQNRHFRESLGKGENYVL
jgi:hypothetical protein